MCYDSKAMTTAAIEYRRLRRFQVILKQPISTSFNKWRVASLYFVINSIIKVKKEFSV